MPEITMADKLHRTEFLGREFLTWLFFRSCRDRENITVDGASYRVHFERMMTLDGENPATEMSTIKVDEPSQSDEVLLSLKLGKKVSRCRMIITVDGVDYTTGFDSATLSFKSLKMPAVKGSEMADIVDEKMELTNAVEDALHSLFVHFVRLRLDSDTWDREAGEIADWIMTQDVLG
ncbi:MAG TPA: hypothetical protein PLZ31_08405 [Myxococcota bacterium]|nr:hypothetical protein [Myxococcota bacterium]HPB51232.1 hypothetical protein [Myxococcota bacterium]